MDKPFTPHIVPNYREENEMRKKAIEIENEFLKEEVMGHGADNTSTRQNQESDTESAIEANDSDESLEI